MRSADYGIHIRPETGWLGWLSFSLVHHQAPLPPTLRFFACQHEHFVGRSLVLVSLLICSVQAHAKSRVPVGVFPNYSGTHPMSTGNYWSRGWKKEGAGTGTKTSTGTNISPNRHTVCPTVPLRVSAGCFLTHTSPRFSCLTTRSTSCRYTYTKARRCLLKSCRRCVCSSREPKIHVRSYSRGPRFAPRSRSSVV